jgi:hypothetical protein
MIHYIVRVSFHVCRPPTIHLQLICSNYGWEGSYDQHGRIFWWGAAAAAAAEPKPLKLIIQAQLKPPRRCGSQSVAICFALWTVPWLWLPPYSAYRAHRHSVLRALISLQQYISGSAPSRAFMQSLSDRGVHGGCCCWAWATCWGDAAIIATNITTRQTPKTSTKLFFRAIPKTQDTDHPNYYKTPHRRSELKNQCRSEVKGSSSC